MYVCIYMYICIHMYVCESKMFTCLVCCRIKSILNPIFKNEIFIYQSKASLDEEFFWQNHSSLRHKSWKLPVRGLYGN